MYKRKRLGPLRSVAIRNSEVGRYSGGVNVQYEWQKKSVPEVASAIWSQSTIGEVRYRRFHCIRNGVYNSINVLVSVTNVHVLSPHKHVKHSSIHVVYMRHLDSLHLGCVYLHQVLPVPAWCPCGHCEQPTLEQSRQAVEHKLINALD